LLNGVFYFRQLGAVAVKGTISVVLLAKFKFLVVLKVAANGTYNIVLVFFFILEHACDTKTG
jgi:hypothetical protein